MIYNNEDTRNKNKVLAQEEALVLLEQGEYGTLSMQTKEGVYGIPLSYAWDGDDAIYLHGALEGRKLDGIKNCNKVSFCIVGATKVISQRFTTDYASIILKAEASIQLDDTEKMKGLMLLINKYSKEDEEQGHKYAQNAAHKTEVIKLSISQWSGKGHQS